jgi:hypothetical protein
MRAATQAGIFSQAHAAVPGSHCDPRNNDCTPAKSLQFYRSSPTGVDVGAPLVYGEAAISGAKFARDWVFCT